MRERGDGRINEVPSGAATKFALLANGYPAVRYLLNDLGQLLSGAGLSAHQLPRASLQRSSVPNEHDIPSRSADGFEDESCDVEHALVELQVGFTWLEVLEGHLRDVSGVDLGREDVWEGGGGRYVQSEFDGITHNV